MRGDGLNIVGIYVKIINFHFKNYSDINYPFRTVMPPINRYIIGILLSFHKKLYYVWDGREKNDG